MVSHNTELIAALSKAIGLKTLVLVERINLATQTKKRLVARGIPSKDIGVVGGGKIETGRRITISTVQSSEHLQDELLKYEVVIADEVHHAKARTYIKLLKKLKNANWRYGLSGTPFNKDMEANWFRMAYLGAVMYEISTKELVERKILSKPIIRVIEIHKPKNPLLHRCDYQTAYRLGIAENAHRNSIICKLANTLPGKTLVLFKMIDHGHILRKYQPRALYADGNTPSGERDKMIAAFNRMDQGTMIASTIFDEGIDLPGIHNLIIASGEKSIIKVIQRLGRGLRQNDTGMVQVFDFMDYTCDFLERHSHERIGIFKEEGHTVRIISTGDE